jgi:hypothetical protein
VSAVGVNVAVAAEAGWATATMPIKQAQAIQATRNGTRTPRTESTDGRPRGSDSFSCVPQERTADAGIVEPLRRCGLRVPERLILRRLALSYALLGRCTDGSCPT